MFRYCCLLVNARLISRRSRESNLAEGRAGESRESDLLSGCSLGRVPSCVALNQSIQLLCQVLSMVACAFEGLRHQQYLETRRLTIAGMFREVFLKQAMADVIQFRVNVKYLPGPFQIQRRKAAVNVLQHVMENDRHLNQVPDIGGGNFVPFPVKPVCDAHHKVADPFEVGDAFEASQQLTSTGFVHTSDRARETFVDLPLNLIKLLFAVANGKESHARRIREEIADIEGRVARNQTSLQCESHELALRAGITG
jgi:hypothetical protein